MSQNDAKLPIVDVTEVGAEGSGPTAWITLALRTVEAPDAPTAFRIDPRQAHQLSDDLLRAVAHIAPKAAGGEGA